MIVAGAVLKSIGIILAICVLIGVFIGLLFGRR